MNKFLVFLGLLIFTTSAFAECFTDEQVKKKNEAAGQPVCTRYENADADKYCLRRWGSSKYKAYISTSLCSRGKYSSRVRSRASLVVASALDEIELMLKKYDRSAVNVWSQIELQSFNHFKTGDTKALFSKFEIAKKELKSFTKNIVDINSKDGVDGVEYARKYFGLMSKISMLYAKTAHESSNTKSWTWKTLDKLNMVVDKRIALELVARFGLKAKHLDEFTLEISLGENDKMVNEFLALQNPETKTGYARLVQFSAIREILTNHYAINRMASHEKLGDGNSYVETPAVKSCGVDMLSFRTKKNAGPHYGSIDTIPYYVETKEADFYHFTFKKNMQKMIDATYEIDIMSETTAYKWIEEILVSSGIKDFLMKSEDGPYWEQSDYDAHVDETVQYLLKNERTHFAQSENHLKVSVFTGDKLTRDNIAKRVVEDAARIRSEALTNAVEVAYRFWPGDVQATVLKDFANKMVNWKATYVRRLTEKVKEALAPITWAKTEKKRKYEQKEKEVMDIFKVTANAFYYSKHKKLASNRRDKDGILIDDINPRTPEELRVYFDAIKGAKENYKLHYSTEIDVEKGGLVDEIFEKISKQYAKAAKGKKVKQLPNVLHGILTNVFTQYAKDYPYDYIKVEHIPNENKYWQDQMTVPADNTRVVLYTPIYDIPKPNMSLPEDHAGSNAARNINDILGSYDKKKKSGANQSNVITMPADSSLTTKNYYQMMAGNIQLKDSLRTKFKKKADELRPMVNVMYNTAADGSGGILTQTELDDNAEQYDSKAPVVYHIAAILGFNYLWDNAAADAAEKDPNKDFWNSRYGYMKLQGSTTANFSSKRGKEALAAQMVQEALVGAPLLGMDYDKKYKSTCYHQTGSGQYGGSTTSYTCWKTKTAPIWKHMLSGYQGGGVFDNDKMKYWVKEVVKTAIKSLKSKTRMFCDANYKDYKNDHENYKKMFNGVSKIRDGFKAPQAQDPWMAKKMAALDEQVKKDMRTTTEVIAEDWDDFLMTFMIILLIVSIVVIPFLGSALALSPAFIMGLNLVVDGIDLIITATHVYARANQYFWEMPAQIKFQQSLAETQLDSQNLTTWDDIRTNKKSLKSQQTMFVAFLPLEAIVGVQFRASFVRFTGSKGAKILKKWKLKPKGWGRPAEAFMKPTAYKALREEGKSVIGAAWFKLRNSVDNGMKYMPRYQSITATELKNVARAGLNQTAKNAGELATKPWKMKGDAQKLLEKVRKRYNVSAEFTKNMGKGLEAIGDGSKVANGLDLLTNPRFFFNQLMKKSKYSKNMLWMKSFWRSIAQGKFKSFILKHGDAMQEMNKLRTELVGQRIKALEDVLAKLEDVEKIAMKDPGLFNKSHSNAFDYFQSLLSDKELKVLQEIALSTKSETRAFAKVFRDDKYLKEVISPLTGVASGMRFGYKFVYPNVYDIEQEDLITKQFAKNIFDEAGTGNPVLPKKETWWKKKAKEMLEQQDELFEQGKINSQSDIQDFQNYYESILKQEGANDLKENADILNRKYESGDPELPEVNEEQARSTIEDHIIDNQ